MTTVLALDLGTHTGWAFTDGETTESGTEDFSPKRGDSTGMRYLLFNRWLKDMSMPGQQGGPGSTYDVDLKVIVYERPHMRGGAATEILHGFSTRVLEYAAKHGIDTHAVHTGTLKKHATGSGKGSKHEMMYEAVRRWPQHFKNKDIEALDLNALKGNEPVFDQVDALWLLDYALTVL